MIYASQIKCIYKNINRTKPCCKWMCPPFFNAPCATSHESAVRRPWSHRKTRWVARDLQQMALGWSAFQAAWRIWRIWRIWTLSGFQWPLSVLMPSNWMQLRSLSYALSSSDIKYSCQTLGKPFCSWGRENCTSQMSQWHVKRFGVITAAPFRQLQYNYNIWPSMVEHSCGGDILLQAAHWHHSSWSRHNVPHLHK